MNGNRVRMIYEAKGMTQQQVADMMGVTTVTLGRWLNGKRNPQLKHIEKLANILDVDLDTLIDNPVKKDKGSVLVLAKNINANIHICLNCGSQISAITGNSQYCPTCGKSLKPLHSTTGFLQFSLDDKQDDWISVKKEGNPKEKGTYWQTYVCADGTKLVGSDNWNGTEWEDGGDIIAYKPYSEPDVYTGE